MFLLGFIQATKGSTRTHDVIFTNGRKKRNDSVNRVLNDCKVVTHQSQSVLASGETLYQLLSNG